MAKLRKAVAAPGSYLTPDGPADVTPARILHWHETVQGMLKDGHKPPVSWGHVSAATPHAEDDVAFWASHFNAGKVAGSHVDADGVLHFDFDVPGGRLEDGKLLAEATLPDGRKVTSAIEEVSVGARDWTDGSGKTWKDAPIHLALTPLPVWVPAGGQPPFVEAAGAPKAQRFGLGGLLYRFATGDKPMAEEKKGGEKDKPAEGEGGAPPIKKVLEALARCGLTLPDDTSPENLLERLYVAAIAQGGDSAGPDETPKPAEEPVMLSTIRDPVTRALLARAEADDRRKRLARIDALVKRGVSPAEAKLLREEASQVRFALSPAGDPLTPPVDAKLDLLERVLPKDGFERTYLGQTVPTATEETPPEEETAKKSSALADELAKAGGLPARKKGA